MNLYTQGKLQEAILERCTGPVWLEDGEEEVLLRDMASGYDPIYQFVGHIPTYEIVIDLYNEYKQDIREAIFYMAAIASGDNEDWVEYSSIKDIITWRLECGLQWMEVPQTHVDFAARCLKIAIDYHAGELVSQLDAEMYS